MKKILFVCLGNICRSPLVEVVARSRFARAGLDIEVASAGTGNYHLGEGADSRAVSSAAARDYDLSMHRARQVARSDFAEYDHLLGMDASNLRILQTRCPVGYESRLGLFLPFSGIDVPDEVPDPYFGGMAGFEHVVDLAQRGVDSMIARLREDA